MERKSETPMAEATRHIETCLFDMPDPQASFKRKRRAKDALGYWATELEHMVNRPAKGQPPPTGRKGSMSSIEQMKRQYAMKQRRQHEDALRGLKELELLAAAITGCVTDCNGEPDNGWQPDLEDAGRLIRVMYWKTVRVRALLEGRETDGCDIELALAERARG